MTDTQGNPTIKVHHFAHPIFRKSMIHSTLHIIRNLADFLLPRKCIVCGEKLTAQEEHICRWCRDDMPQTRFWQLRHNPMADKINAAIQKELEKRWEDTDTTRGFVNPCTVASIASELRNSAYDNVKSSKNFNSERYAFAAALFFFNEEADYKKIPYRIKYEGDIRAGRYFGKMLGDRLSRAEWFQDVDIIIPVPLHWRRKWKRGYNQAEIIAHGISEALGIPVRTDILRRRKHTRTQINLNIQEKSANVAGAFSASLPQTRSTNTDNVTSDKTGSNRTYRPRHILLVDDVFTTGSTLTACFFALRSDFPPEVRISVATLGFVGRF